MTKTVTDFPQTDINNDELANKLMWKIFLLLAKWIQIVTLCGHKKMLNEFHMRTELKQRALFTLKYNLTRLIQIALELMCTIVNNVQNVMISFHLCSSLHQPSNIVITYFTN